MKRSQTVFLKLCLADALLKLMEQQTFDTINVNAICEQAGVGRTTFYRHLDNKSGKEELLLFKISYEWGKYRENHEEEEKEDKGFALLNFIYEYKKMFLLLNKNGLVTVVMKMIENLILGETPHNKEQSYILAFFSYGYFGVIYQWIKYGFDETPQQIQKNITNTFMAAQNKI